MRNRHADMGSVMRARRLHSWGLAVAAPILLQACALATTGSTTEDTLQLIKSQNVSGCIYIRGNARPFADVTILSVNTYGPKAPNYLECIKAIPDALRELTLP